jgi:hypothetical protein
MDFICLKPDLLIHGNPDDPKKAYNLKKKGGE